MFKHVLKVILVLFVAQAQARSSYIPKTKTLAEQASGLNISTTVFMPTIRSDHDGNLLEYDVGEGYRSADLNLSGSYGFTTNLEVTAGVRTRYIQSSETISNEDVVFTKSGIESGFLQFKYSFPVADGMQYSLEANYRSSFYTNPEYDPATTRDSIVLGEGGTEVSFGLGVSYLTDSHNYLSGRFLYSNPAEHLSSEIYSEIEGAIVWPSFTMLLGVENVYSMGQDPYATTPDDKPQISNGTTSQYNSINRGWTAPYGGMNFAINDLWRIEFKVMSKLYGVSTDLGNLYTISLIKRSEGPAAFKAKDASFKEYKYEGSVTKLSTNRNVAIVDMGLKKGLELGNRVDFFHFDYLDGNQLIATGVVVKVGLEKSLVKITERYSKLRVEAGTVARSGLIGD